MWLLDSVPAPFNPVPLGSTDRPEAAFIGCKAVLLPVGGRREKKVVASVGTFLGFLSFHLDFRVAFLVAFLYSNRNPA